MNEDQKYLNASHETQMWRLSGGGGKGYLTSAGKSGRHLLKKKKKLDSYFNLILKILVL